MIETAIRYTVRGADQVLIGLNLLLQRSLYAWHEGRLQGTRCLIDVALLHIGIALLIPAATKRSTILHEDAISAARHIIESECRDVATRASIHCVGRNGALGDRRRVSSRKTGSSRSNDLYPACISEDCTSRNRHWGRGAIIKDQRSRGYGGRRVPCTTRIDRLGQC